MSDHNDDFDGGTSRELILDDAEEPEFPWSVPGSGNPRQGAAGRPGKGGEGVRIIGADEAAAAIEAGQVAGRQPRNAPRFGDVPEAPSGPRPSLRFPGADPASVEKPPVVPPEPAPRRAAAPPRRSYDQRVDDSGEGNWDDVVASHNPRVSPGAGAGAPGHYPPRYVADEYAGAEAPGAGGGDAWFDDEPAPAPASARPAMPDPDLADMSSGATELPHWTEPPTGENPRILADAPGAPTGSREDDDLRAWATLSTGPRWRDQPTDWEEADFDEAVLDDPGTRVGALRIAEPEADDEFVDPRTVAPRSSAGGPRDYETDDPYSPVDASPRPAGYAPEPRGGGPVRVGGRGNGGPMGPPYGGTGNSDITTRVVTGAVALAVVLIAAVIGPGALAFLVGAVLVLAAAELYSALRSRGYHPATLLGLAATASLSATVYWRFEDGFGLILALFMVFALLWYLVGVVRARPTVNIAATAFGFMYVGFLGSFAPLILGRAGKNGIGILLGAILATAAADIGAFFVGRWAGKTPLAPQLSPNKTVEGLVGGTFATLMVCLVVVRAIHPWTAGRAFWLAIVVSIAAPLGDLCESMIKRDLDVKDMGSLLPGHGGVFDRIDALLFVAPATYYLLRVLG